MPKKIILVRHGQTDFNKQKHLQGHLDTFLNSVGLKQAREAALKLKDESIDVIISSDLKRAHQTAILIAELVKAPIITTKLLRERDYGEVQGLSFREIKKQFNLQYTEIDFFGLTFDDRLSKSLNIESNKQMFERIDKFYKDILSKYKNQNILLSVHGGILRVILIYLKIRKVFLSLPNTSIVVLKKANNKYVLDLN